MASTYSAISCPHCNCCATKDDYYKTGEKFILCYRCGYSCSRTFDYLNGNEPVYQENEYKGHGVCLVRKQDGTGTRNFFQRHLSSEEITKNIEALSEEGVDIENSYFVLFKNGVFKTLAGNPPEDFYLSFEDYKKKREENNQQLEVIVPFN
ncbi:hypothetical protein [Oceanobacillus saliphilus]|uniref:hypothetical protein n=1 Tax=Oceanobacillus saliphilus TaxID=2925834 RepID=UPI00201D605C|nr:hypothetical protein [Oceanobacillus saliphilus]